MGVIPKIKKPHKSGMNLVIMAIPLLIVFIAVPQAGEDRKREHHEFSNVRIVKLFLSVSRTKTDFIRQVTVHFDSIHPPFWCQSADSTASRCPYPAGGQKHELHRKDKMSLPGTPLL